MHGWLPCKPTTRLINLCFGSFGDINDMISPRFTYIFFIAHFDRKTQSSVLLLYGFKAGCIDTPVIMCEIDNKKYSHLKKKLNEK